MRRARRPDDTDTVGTVRSRRSDRRRHTRSLSSSTSYHERPSAMLAADDGAHARAADDVDRDPQLVERAQHTDVGHAAGAAAAEHEPHRVAGEQAPDAGDVGGRARSHVVRRRRLDGSRPGAAHAAGNGRRAAEEHEVDGRGGEGVDTGPPGGDAVEPVRRRIGPPHEHDAIGLAEDRDRIGVGAVDRDDVHAVADRRVSSSSNHRRSAGPTMASTAMTAGRPGWASIASGVAKRAANRRATPVETSERAINDGEPLRWDAHQQRVTGDDRGPRPPAADEQRTLAERDPRPGVGGEPADPVGIEEEAHPAGEDPVHAVRRIAGAEQSAAGGQPEPLDVGGQRLAGLLVQPRERHQRLQAGGAIRWSRHRARARSRGVLGGARVPGTGPVALEMASYVDAVTVLVPPTGAGVPPGPETRRRGPIRLGDDDTRRSGLSMDLRPASKCDARHCVRVVGDPPGRSETTMSARRARHRTAFGLAFIGVVIAGGAVAPTRAPAHDTPVPALEWADCGGGFDCATVLVPLDHRGRAAARSRCR